MNGGMDAGLDRMAIGVLLLAGTVALPSLCLAQGIPFSQRGAVHQTVAFTEITVEYSRPVARGRVLFGDSAVVRWDRIWHPGADSATRISFSHDMLLEGHPVRAGTYSLWLLPRAHAPWTLILSSAVYVYHAPYPGEASDVLRIEVTPERGAHMETLAIYFPLVLRDDAIMRVHWGDMILPVRIKAPHRPPVPPDG
ncbi:hypothetical protein BH23GEM2_BH23GEM2_17610 [soil metagenome]